jgi:hypothetical protein
MTTRGWWGDDSESMIDMKKPILTLFILFAFAGSAWGATYTVCSSGCDETTIQAVFDNNDLAAGDIVDVTDSGTYRETVTWGSNDGGSSGNPVTLSSTGGATIDGSDIVSTWTASLGSELLTNGNCEADANWINQGSPTVNERSEEQVHGGTYSRKFTVDAQAEGLSNDTLSIVSGNSYRVTFWLYGDGTNEVTARVLVGGDTHYATNMAWQDNYVAPASWTEHTYDFTATSTDGTADFEVFSDHGETTGTWYVDDASVKQILSNVWDASLASETHAVRFDGARGTEETGTCPSDLDTDQEWCWTGGKLYQSSTSDPDTRYTSPGTEAYQRQFGLYIRNVEFVVVDGLTFTGHQHTDDRSTRNEWGAGISIVIPNANDTYENWTVQNCTFEYEGDISILGWFEWMAIPGGRTVKDLTITGNTFNEGNWEADITLSYFIVLWAAYGTGDTFFTDVTITENDIYQDLAINPTNGGAVQTDGINIYVTGGDIDVSENEIEGASHGIVFYGKDNTSDLGTIAYNYVHDNSDDCIWLTTQFAAAVIRNNICHNGLDQGIDTWWASADTNTQSGLKIYNNIISDSANSGIMLVKTANTEIKNNIFYNCGNAAGTEQYFALSIRDDINGEANVTLPTLVSDNNQVYNSNGPLFNIIEATGRDDDLTFVHPPSHKPRHRCRSGFRRNIR